MKNIKDYQKLNKDNNAVNTSVTITKDQRAFIEKNRINLSAFVRGQINALIKQHESVELNAFKKAE